MKYWQHNASIQEGCMYSSGRRYHYNLKSRIRERLPVPTLVV